MRELDDFDERDYYIIFVTERIYIDKYYVGSVRIVKI